MNPTDFNFFDILYSLIFLGYVFVGLSRGFVLQLSSVVFIFTAYFAGVTFQLFGAGCLDFLGMKSEAVSTLSFFIGFFTIIILSSLTGLLLRQMLKKKKGNFVTGFLGLLLGLLEAWLISSIIHSIVSQNIPLLADDEIKSFYHTALAFMDSFVVNINNIFFSGVNFSC